MSTARVTARSTDLPLTRVHALLAALDGAMVEPLGGLFGGLPTLARDPSSLFEIESAGAMLSHECRGIWTSGPEFTHLRFRHPEPRYG